MWRRSTLAILTTVQEAQDLNSSQVLNMTTNPDDVRRVDYLLDSYIWTALDKDVYDPHVRNHLESMDDEVEGIIIFHYHCHFYFFFVHRLSRLAPLIGIDQNTRRYQTFIDHRLIIQELIKDFLLSHHTQDGFEITKDVSRNLFDLIDYWMEDNRLSSEDAAATLYGLRSFVSSPLLLSIRHCLIWNRLVSLVYDQKFLCQS